jgi:hypothetical protein
VTTYEGLQFVTGISDDGIVAGTGEFGAGYRLVYGSAYGTEQGHVVIAPFNGTVAITGGSVSLNAHTVTGTVVAGQELLISVDATGQTMYGFTAVFTQA